MHNEKYESHEDISEFKMSYNFKNAKSRDAQSIREIPHMNKKGEEKLEREI